MKRQDRARKINVLPIIVILLLIASVYFAFNFYKSSLKPMSSNDKDFIEVEIPSGSSTQDIGEILENKNLIKNKWIFLLKTKTSDDIGSLKAGNYELSKSMDLEEIILSLVSGGKSDNTVRFTIPEGYELVDTAKKLSDEKIVDLDRFTKLTEDKKNFEEEFTFLNQLDDGQSLEGYLYPSTYEIYKDHNEEDVIKIMLKEFEKIYKSDIENKLADMDYDLNELITLASIVEREAKLDIERATISGVFHNRLKTDMNLGSCATVQYIIGERREILTNEETKIDSPFNTYINKGLPPAPIASPGEKSLLAAVNPEDVEYLYFRVSGKGDGSHTFTNTYEEHQNANPNK